MQKFKNLTQKFSLFSIIFVNGIETDIERYEKIKDKKKLSFFTYKTNFSVRIITTAESFVFQFEWMLINVY